MPDDALRRGTPASLYFLLILFALIVLFLLVVGCCCDEDDDPADQPAVESAEAEQRVDEPAPAESAEQRLARAWAEREALAARAEAALAARAEAALPVLLPLPYFPYAADQGGDDKPSSETAECAICLEPLRPGQLCSEVPPCRHVFHRDCLGEWARSNGSCPLCRAKIVPGSEEIAMADDMV